MTAFRPSYSTPFFVHAEDAMNAARERFRTRRSNPGMDMVAWMVTEAPHRLVLEARPKSIRTPGSGRSQPHTLGALLVGILEEASLYGHTYSLGCAIDEFVARALAVIYPMMNRAPRAFKGIAVGPKPRSYLAIADGVDSEAVWFEQKPGTREGLFAEQIEFEVTLQRAMTHFRLEPDNWPRKIARMPADPAEEIERLGAALRGIE